MRDIIFLYLTSAGFILSNQKTTISGNVQLRVFNVVENLQKYYPELNVYCYDLIDFLDQKKYHHHSIDQSIIILNKGCFQKPSYILSLKDQGYQLVSDYIDIDPKLMNCCIAHISSSVGLHSYLSTNYQNVYHIIHGFDNHFDRSTYQLNQSDELKMVYCGAADNIPLMLYYHFYTDVTWIDSCTWWKKEYYTDDWFQKLSKKERDEMLQRKNGRWVEVTRKYLQPQTFDWKDQLKYYNCHLGLRHYDQYAPFKPFTKGFTAAALRSPIVVDSHNLDAKYYLPSDYPLFSPIDGPVNTTQKIDSILNYIRSIYHTPQWDYALHCMDQLYLKCKPQTIAKRWNVVLQKINQLF